MIMILVNVITKTVIKKIENTHYIETQVLYCSNTYVSLY